MCVRTATGTRPCTETTAHGPGRNGGSGCGGIGCDCGGSARQRNVSKGDRQWTQARDTFKGRNTK
jgi:hypothetical protein